MQAFGWYHFFQIITILLCIFVKAEDNIDFEYIIKTVKVNIHYHVQTILYLKILLLLMKSGNSDILQKL